MNNSWTSPSPIRVIGIFIDSFVFVCGVRAEVQREFGPKPWTTMATWWTISFSIAEKANLVVECFTAATRPLPEPLHRWPLLKWLLIELKMISNCRDLREKKRGRMKERQKQRKKKCLLPIKSGAGGYIHLKAFSDGRFGASSCQAWQ